MLLAATTVEDLDRFTDVFSTKGAEKRRQHGSRGAHVFRDPNQADRVWVIFDWDLDGWESFASDREVPPIMQDAGPASSPPPIRALRLNVALPRLDTETAYADASRHGARASLALPAGTRCFGPGLV